MSVSTPISAIATSDVEVEVALHAPHAERVGEFVVGDARLLLLLILLRLRRLRWVGRVGDVARRL